MFEFPLEMFLPGSDLTPLKENIDKVVYGLTKWQPKLKEKKIEVPEKLTVEGEDYEEAVVNMNNLFLRNFWSDGLPLLPPTEERVKRILTGTSLSPDTVIGKILPRGGISTVETLAISLAMAGGRPEYLPVLIAAIEALIDPGVQHQVLNATTCSIYPAVIVNGPVAKQIRLSSGYGCLGPNPEYPAGGAIGRAIRLILLIVGGGIPGRGSMAIYGGANRYTNIVFAEDEDGLPSDWEPINASYFGYPRGTNTVALHWVSGTNNVVGTSVGTAETALSTLHTFAGMMGVTNWNYWGRVERFEGSPGILLMARGTAQGLAKFGWSKEKVQAFLWENSKIPWSMIKNACAPDKLKERIEPHKPYLSMNKPWPITSKPENIMIAVAGGEQSGHGYWMQIGNSYHPTCKEIKLPPNWDELLNKAERDLGPLPRTR
ncbi:hypothetical protein ACFLWL_01490 [Chloroflexota bacterium]